MRVCVCMCVFGRGCARVWVWVLGCPPPLFPIPPTLRPISSEEDGIRGSCATHREREDITPSVLQEEMGLATLATKYAVTYMYMYMCMWALPLTV